MFDFDGRLDALRQKDEAAFGEIYEQTKRGVYAVIVAIVRDRGTTEDLMQETYMRMLANLDQYEPGRNFNAWLVQIAKNLALDHYRKERRTTPVDPQEQSYVFDRVEPAGPAEYDLESLVAPLDSEERQIVLLHVVSDHKFKDIATIVGKPLGTVLWLYNRAIRKMQRHVGKEEP
ncbi:MAG: RNA polymerase sigma factor [Candidatus Izemoplasmatales bacterium]